MGMNAALKTQQILENAYGVLGDRADRRGAGARLPRVHARATARAPRTAAVRKVVEHLDVDRPLFPDHNAMMAAVERCDVLEAVEAEIGPLANSW